MPIIHAPLGSVKEPQAVPEGIFELRIIKFEEGESKKGNAMTTVYIKVEDAAYPNAAIIRHWITQPAHDTPADQRQMRLLDLKRFLTAFGIPFEEDAYNTDDFQGATARCNLKQEEGDDGNLYNRLVLPRLND
jgi:hypothetical protein